MTHQLYYIWAFIALVAVVSFSIGYIAGREKGPKDPQ